ncbi:hypothetical protein [Bacillus paramycoides]|uniref:hypothetical protein n=1 Tax=Bacillus paramycoides TaxID=2026194 RepID=UPI002E21418B|nr:hypothetical protein [Bacillus paramycoides]
MNKLPNSMKNVVEKIKNIEIPNLFPEPALAGIGNGGGRNALGGELLSVAKSETKGQAQNVNRLSGEKLPAEGVGEANPNIVRTNMLKEKYSHLSASERSARLQELAEENAYRRVQEMESNISGAHFLEKHGAQTSLQSQLDRVQYAVNPTINIIETYPNGRLKLPSSATRFFSHRDQLNMIGRAQQILKNIGDLDLAQMPITYKNMIGSGYQRGTLNYGQSYTGQVFFRNNQPITAFPIWGR